MNWLVWILIGVIATSVSNILQRVLMKEDDSDPVAYTVVFLVILTVMTGAFSLYKGFVLPQLSDYWFNFLLSTVLYAIGVISWFKALKGIESSEAAIIASFGAIITVITAIIFLDEVLLFRQVVGVALIVVSIILLNAKRGKFRFTQASWLALLSTSCYGVAATNDLFILSRGYDAVSFVPVMSLTPALLIVIIRPSIMKHLSRYLSGSFLKKMFLMTFFYAIQAVTYYIAFEQGGQASQISPIAKSSIILTVIMGMLFLKERSNVLIKLLSAGLVTIGVLLIK